MSNVSAGDLAIIIGVKKEETFDCDGRIVQVLSIAKPDFEFPDKLNWEIKFVGALPKSCRYAIGVMVFDCMLRRISGPPVDEYIETDNPIKHKETT